jgi:tetratricopeptide (TPR) repeat protein
MLPDAILTRLQLALMLHRGHGPSALRDLIADARTGGDGSTGPRTALVQTHPGGTPAQMTLQILYDQANAAMREHRWAAALRVIDDILRVAPDNAVAHANRGSALLELGQSEAALVAVGRALALAPDDPMAQRNRGLALHRLGRWREAVAAFDAVLRGRPEDADTLMQRGATRYALGDTEAAVSDLRDAARLRPEHVATLSNLGLVLEAADQVDEALACCDRALALAPRDLDATLNRGVVLQRLRRFDAALACFDDVIAQRPDDANADYNASLIHLAQGDYPKGWARHEARWRTDNLRAAARGLAQPQWRGEAIAPGQTILLHAEQGLGDTLQFCRYVPAVAARADVVLEVPRALVRLLSGVPGVRAVVAQGDALPAFDLQCPLLSLPLAFGTTLETIPGAVPYLQAAPKAVQAWRRRLQALPGTRVGLVWAGRARADSASLRSVDRRRSMRLADFAPLAAVPGVAFVSLQKGPEADQIQAAPAGLVVHDWTRELEDFADTAALVAALDVVITVDTAVAHLAGALGKTVWVLNRFDACWRWLEGRADSPWYPSARLFRQREVGEWGAVVAEVAAALREVGAPVRRRARRRTAAG